jgi:hypothetical protein
VAVPAGDTLDVRLASGATRRVRLAGLVAPGHGECYARQSAARTRGLALGKRVVLVSRGSAAGGVAVLLPGGRDLGRLLVAAGAAQVDPRARSLDGLLAYVPAQQQAELANRGMWGACAADLAVRLVPSADTVDVGGKLEYAVTVTNEGRRAARRVALDLRAPAGAKLESAESADGSCTVVAWRGGCSLGTIAAGATATARFAGVAGQEGPASAVAAARFDPCLRFPCAGAALHDSDRRDDEAAALTIVRGAEPPPNPTSGGCHPSYPRVCIPPAPPDLDCAHITHRDFYVRRDLPDPDPHEFDKSLDGIGCQFDDY